MAVPGYCQQMRCGANGDPAKMGYKTDTNRHTCAETQFRYSPWGGMESIAATRRLFSVSSRSAAPLRLLFDLVGKSWTWPANSVTLLRWAVYNLQRPPGAGKGRHRTWSEQPQGGLRCIFLRIVGPKTDPSRVPPIPAATTVVTGR